MKTNTIIRYMTWLTGIAAVLATGPAARAGDQLTTIATGLDSPRGLAFGPNGALYVAEAGLGAGDVNSGFAPGVGFSGAITEIRRPLSAHPMQRRIVTGLVSVGTSENGPNAVGPDGISVLGNGGIFVILAESAEAEAESFPDLSIEAAAQLGHLIKINPGGRVKILSDVGDTDYDWANANKGQEWAPTGQFPDANPYGVLALPGRRYVADAGANTLDEVGANGSVRILAYFPNPLLPFGPGGALVPVSDAVPTCVARGPDGWLYVGTLAFGANFASKTPQSKIYRVNPHGTKFFLDDSDVWASELNPIVACAFGNGALYVVEYTMASSPHATGDVVRIAINSDGSAGARTVLGAGALEQPNGLAISRNGEIFVSNKSVSFGGGEVVRVNY
jgi:hypothetical protein